MARRWLWRGRVAGVTLGVLAVLAMAGPVPAATAEPPTSSSVGSSVGTATGPSTDLTAADPAPITGDPSSPGVAAAPDGDPVTSSTATTATTTATTPVTTATTTGTTATSTAEALDENCTQVWNAIGRPLNVGEPGYRIELDRDGDGVACEVDPRLSTSPVAATPTTLAAVVAVVATGPTSTGPTSNTTASSGAAAPLAATGLAGDRLLLAGSALILLGGSLVIAAGARRRPPALRRPPRHAP